MRSFLVLITFSVVVFGLMPSLQLPQLFFSRDTMITAVILALILFGAARVMQDKEYGVPSYPGRDNGHTTSRFSHLRWNWRGSAKSHRTFLSSVGHGATPSLGNLAFLGGHSPQRHLKM